MAILLWIQRQLDTQFTTESTTWRLRLLSIVFKTGPIIEFYGSTNQKRIDATTDVYSQIALILWTKSFLIETKLLSRNRCMRPLWYKNNNIPFTFQIKRQFASKAFDVGWKICFLSSAISIIHLFPFIGQYISLSKLKTPFVSFYKTFHKLSVRCLNRRTLLLKSK